MLWRQRGAARQAVDARYRRHTADRQLEGRHGHGTRRGRTGTSSGQLRTNAKVESSPVVVDGIAYFGATDGTAVRRRRGDGQRALGLRHRRPDQLEPVRRRATASASRRTRARSSACDSTNGHKLWSTYVKRDPFRYESFYASASTDGERLYTIARSGKIVALSAVDRRHVLWTHHVGSLGYSTPAVGRDRVFVGGFDGAPPRLRARPTARSSGGRTVGGRILGGAGRRRQPRLLLDARAEDLRGARLATGRSCGRSGSASTRPGSRPSAPTTSR